MGKLFDNPHMKRVHPATNTGQQRLYKFDNGFGASVVRFKTFGGIYGSYTSDSTEWELGVLEWNNESYQLTYDTPITDDVLGHLTEDEVEEVLERISKLPKREES